MKRKKYSPVVTPEPQAKNEYGIPEMKPGDELQVYYNDAYMREKARLNEIFGIIPEDEPAKKDPPPAPDMNDYVHIKAFRRLKKRYSFLAFLTVVFALATAALVILYFIKK